MAFHSFISLITPFKVNKEIDFESLDHLIISHQKSEKKAILLGSEVGEGDFLSLDEKVSLFKRGKLLLQESPSVYFKESSFDLFFESLLKFKNIGLSSAYVDLSLLCKEEEGEVFDFCFSLSRLRLEIIVEPPKGLFTQKFLYQIEALPHLSTLCSNEQKKPKSGLIRFEINSLEQEKHRQKQSAYLKNFDPFFNPNLKKRKEILEIKKEEMVLVAKHLLSMKGIVTPSSRIPGALCEKKKRSFIDLAL